MRYLYLPQIRKKKIPTSFENEIMYRKLKMALALAYVDTKRLFIENIENVKISFEYDISKSQIFFDVLTGASSLFSITGFSFNISRKILDYAKNSILNKNANATISLHFFKFIESIHNSLVGKWDEDLDEGLIHSALEKGDISAASGCLVWLGYSKIEIGDFEKTENILKSLDNISNEYNFKHAKLDFYYLKSKLLMKKRELNGAKRYVKEGIILLDKIDLDIRKVEFLGLLSRILTLQNDDKAENYISEAVELVMKVGKQAILTNYYSDFLMGIFSHNLRLLEKNIISSENQVYAEYKKTAFKSGKQAVKHCRNKVSNDRTEAYRLMGTYYWITDHQRKALKWWKKSIEEGKRLIAKPELSRTYFEVGKRLSENRSEYKNLNGVKAIKYLEMSGTLFNDLNLRWDLEELDRVGCQIE
jgi:hypothetical protein